MKKKAKGQFSDSPWHAVKSELSFGVHRIRARNFLADDLILINELYISLDSKPGWPIDCPLLENLINRRFKFDAQHSMLFLVCCPMTRKPIPSPCFLDDQESLGAFNGKKRWRSNSGGRIFEWDSFHGEIEVYNARGKHLGALDPKGVLIKDPVPGRKIDV